MLQGTEFNEKREISIFSNIMYVQYVLQAYLFSLISQSMH